MWGHLTSSLRRLTVRSGEPHTAPDKPLVTVFGATGAQGSSVVHALLESGRYRIRAVTRHPDSQRCGKLRDAKVQVVKADQANRDEVRAALEGAYGVYLVTDYYSLGGKEYDVGKSVVEVAKEAGVQHVVLSTLPHVERLSKGRLSVPHFTNKARVEEAVRECGFQHHTFVMCAFYYQNFAHFNLCRAAEDGTVVFELPMAPDDMLTAFDVDDTGAAVLNALDHPDEWHDEYMCLAGYHAPVQQYVRDFEKVTGRPARLETTDRAANEEWTQMFRWFSQHTYYGCHDISNARRCNPHLKTWRQWLQETGWRGPEGEVKGEMKGEAKEKGEVKESGKGAKEVEHGGEVPATTHVAGA